VQQRKQGKRPDRDALPTKSGAPGPHDYDRFSDDPAIDRLHKLEERLHGFDIATILGLVIAVISMPVVFALCFLRMR
jgi:hypothetical protein